MRKEVFVNFDAAKAAQHAEGRHAALSGNHPLNALCHSAVARKAFEKCACAVATIFARFDVRGYSISVRDVKEVSNSLRGRICVAIQKGKLKRRDCYGAMSASRTVVEIGVKTFHCRDVVYSDELHAALSRGQAHVKTDDGNNLGDVFSFFGISSTGAFRKLLLIVQRKLQKAFEDAVFVQARSFGRG